MSSILMTAHHYRMRKIVNQTQLKVVANLTPQTVDCLKMAAFLHLA